MINIVIDRIRSIGLRKTLFLVSKRFTQSISGIQHLRIRHCRCCGSLSLFLCLGNGEEAIRCIRCGANLRYELLAELIRNRIGSHLCELVVVEFDPGSPLKRLLSGAKKHVRTYYSKDCTAGSLRADGAQCEDLTCLTFANSSIDLMVSSDVLEHIPNVSGAFKETSRVLKKGGTHIFTVPTHRKTVRRATIDDGKLIHLEEPEYHLDPLSEKGILAFWHFGTEDLGKTFATEDLEITKAAGPVGKDNRIVWTARKIG